MKISLVQLNTIIVMNNKFAKIIMKLNNNASFARNLNNSCIKIKRMKQM